MNKHLDLRFACHVLALTACFGTQSLGVVVMADSPKVKWAIAIHGGAGGGPQRWGEEKSRKKQEGLKDALAVGQKILQDGGSALDAVEAVINSMEDNSNFNAGRGAVRTTEGKAELDASVMDGQTLQCGAVAGVTTVKNPISLARLVMSKTKHVLLAGKGADEFAKGQQIPIVDPNYFLSLQPSEDHMHFGTVGCVAMDQNGNLAAGTSTGGTSQKLAGRVGDSPIVGAGTYAANGVCAVSGTGVGEEYIRNAVAYDIAAQMKYADATLNAAVTRVMTETLEKNTGGIISVDQSGNIVLQHNTPAMSCGAADSTGRFETFLSLPGGGRQQAESEDSDQKVIESLLSKQAADWNSGDIDAFMDVYWKSKDLTFSSSGKTTRGWEATLSGYKKRYPDKKTMGSLTFSELEFRRLDTAAMQVLGTWNLQRDENPIGGRFTLIFTKIDGQWRIVHDHTSALNP